MERARNNLKLELVGEADFGGVVAVQGHALENLPEAALHLPAPGFVAAAARNAVAAERFVIEGPQQGNLLRLRRLDKILAKQGVALLIDASKGIQEVLAFVLVGPLGKDYVDEFVHARGFGAGRIGDGNDEIDHRENGFVLVRAKATKLVSGMGLRRAQVRKNLRREPRQDGAGRQHAEEFTP